MRQTYFWRALGCMVGLYAVSLAQGKYHDLTWAMTALAAVLVVLAVRWHLVACEKAQRLEVARVNAKLARARAKRLFAESGKDNEALSREFSELDGRADADPWEGDWTETQYTTMQDLWTRLANKIEPPRSDPWVAVDEEW